MNRWHKCPVGFRWRLRPDRAVIDPGLQGCDLVGGQTFAPRRHDVSGVARADPGQQRGLGGFTGNDGGLTRLAAGKGGGARIEPQAGLLLVRPVAFGTAFDQDRLDVVFEIDGRRASGQDGGQPDTEKDRSHHHAFVGLGAADQKASVLGRVGKL